MKESNQKVINIIFIHHDGSSLLLANYFQKTSFSSWTHPVKIKPEDEVAVEIADIDAEAVGFDECLGKRLRKGNDFCLRLSLLDDRELCPSLLAISLVFN